VAGVGIAASHRSVNLLYGIVTLVQLATLTWFICVTLVRQCITCRETCTTSIIRPHSEHEDDADRVKCDNGSCWKNPEGSSEEDLLGLCGGEYEEVGQLQRGCTV